MPTELFQSGLQLFVEANELAGADGSDVSLWADLSANGRDLEPVGAGGLPDVNTGAVNSKKSVQWTGGGIVPLGNTDTFRIKCGFVVAKIGQATFNAIRGLLTGIDTYPILVGNNGATTLFDHQISDYYEYRLNNRIYSPVETWANGVRTELHNPPAPMNTWGIIYFRFWRSLILDGVQVGRDRGFSGRELVGEVAMIALYDRVFCESDLKKQMDSIAFSYQLPLVETYPLMGSRGDTVGGGKEVLSDGQIEPVTSVVATTRKAFSASFTTRSMAKIKEERAFYDAMYPNKKFIFRDGNLVPPEDTVVRYQVPQAREFAENLNLSGFTREFVESALEPETYTPGAQVEIPEEASAIIDEEFPDSGGDDEILDGGDIG